MSDEQQITGDDVGELRDVDPDTGEVSAVEVVSSPELARYLGGGKAAVEEDPEQIAFEIVQRILSATNADDVLGRQRVLSAEELKGHPIEVQSVKWHKSAYDQREAMYALVTGKRVDTGDEILFTCGGRNVMAQLWRLQELDAFPIAVKVGSTDKPTAAGYYPLWLEPAPQ